MIIDELKEFQSFFFDLDGVIWNNHRPLPGSSELIQRLQTLGKEIYFISNNCELSRRNICEALERYSIHSKIENIICGSSSCALWATNNCQAHSKILTIGAKGLDEELVDAGFHIVPAASLISPDVDYADIQTDDDIKIVVVADTLTLSYHNIAYASRCMQKGAKLIAPNYYDANWKLGRFKIPCSACTINALVASARDKTFVTPGKPHPMMLESIIKRDSLDKAKIIIFGDTMPTDILLAKNCEVKSALVLTGNESSESYLRFSFRPDFVYTNLVEVLK
ncbi:unnamed protein product [Blepharisma stoltei]|uniref:Phosphoglycolate phosphatase n=1 Tax=Blepharisma stoltei TaxID=1481888 RepID=A0AAU9J4L0_9CILI|nr:unnamed protein product [Blepharisma stoltei]